MTFSGLKSLHDATELIAHAGAELNVLARLKTATNRLASGHMCLVFHFISWTYVAV